MLRRIDDAWARFEKFGVVAGFLLMSAVVFADVLHRIFADRAWQTPGRLAVVGVIAFGIALAAVRAASSARTKASPVVGDRITGWTRSVTVAAVGTAIVAAIVYGFIWLWPSGVIWAQTLALVLMIWVAFFGGSIATRENKHLKVDAAERLFEGDAKRWVEGGSHLVAALGSGALCVLAVGFCLYHYGIWRETGGAGGDFEGLPIPKFIAFAVLPVELGAMTLRFAANAVRTVRSTAAAAAAPEVGR